MKKGDILKRIPCAHLLGVGAVAYGDLPFGLIGGQPLDSGGYAAYVYPNGDFLTIPGLPSMDHNVYSAAINNSGVGLIGGRNGDGGFAALLSPDGSADVLSLSLPVGYVNSVSINNARTGLLAGRIGSGGDIAPFAAFVSPSGTVTPIATDAKYLICASINNSGVGLLGGEGALGMGDGKPFATFVGADGSTTDLSGMPEFTGDIYSVQINDLGVGLIGGWLYNGTQIPYTAKVTDRISTPTELTLPISNGIINSVAINNSAEGLIGGFTDSTRLFAARIAPNGNVDFLLGDSINGTIYSVAINDSGTGIIGGDSEGLVYAAFISPTLTITQIDFSGLGGSLNSVAINSAGIALVGGDISPGFAALIAPNGAVTQIDLGTNSYDINWVALTQVVNSATPKSSGSFLGPVYGQLAASSALESRFISQHRSAKGRTTPQRAIAQNDLVCSTKPVVKKGTLVPERSSPHSVWVAPFGEYIHLDQAGSIPSYSNTVGGALAAYDYQKESYMVGVAVGYAFNYLHYSEGLGHGKVQEEMLSLYGAYTQEHFWLDGALWGGVYQFWNTRHTLSTITSKAMTHGWILSPHFEMASPWAIDLEKRYYVEPFVLFDWVNTWQNGYTEHGSSGLNLKMKSHYGSLLQSEVGLRFYEEFPYSWGQFLLEQKAAYVNQAPFHFNSTTTAFVGSASSFPIAIGNTDVQNLACFQLMGAFSPKKTSHPYGGASFEVMVNGDYQSYFGNIFLGKAF